MTATPTSLDPHLQDETAAYTVLVNVYQGLVALDGDLRLQPALATSWENPNDLTFRFHLRPGVRFHDGRPLEAADVVASLGRAIHHPDSQVAGYLSGLQSIRAVDDTTVDLVLEAPSAVFLNKLALGWIAPRDAPPRVDEPIGTGPYRWAGYGDHGEHLLERFEDYWGTRPAVARASFRTLSDGPTRESMLENGEVDLIESPSAAFIRSLRSSAELVVAGRETPDFAYLHLGTTRPPFDDRRVRLAVHLAVDRNQIAEGPLQGFARPATQLASRQVFGYDPNIALVERDVAAARRLLAEAGYGDGVDVVLEYPNSNVTAALLTEQLAEAGFRVVQEKHPWPEMYERLKAGSVDFYFGLVSNTTGDSSDLLESKLHSKTANGRLGSGNFTGYSNPQLDRLIAKSAAILDPTLRLEVLQESMRLAMHDLPLIPLYVPTSRVAMRASLRFEPRVDSALELARMSWDSAGGGGTTAAP